MIHNWRSLLYVYTPVAYTLWSEPYTFCQATQYTYWFVLAGSITYLELIVDADVLQGKGGVNKVAKIGLELTIKIANGITITFVIPFKIIPQFTNRLIVIFVPCIKRDDIINAALVHVCGSVRIKDTVLQAQACINNKITRIPLAREKDSIWLTPNQKKYCFDLISP